MNQLRNNQYGVHTALFVDFDNIYISLAEQDSYVANQFATNPEKWLTWLEQELPFAHLHTEATYRRILVRRCYLNPQSFSNYRPYFIRSAFEVIDCPPLTTRGKTSTDIHMVMDILDALNHSTYFSEFVILSGDADFTPVLLRLRKNDRYSAVLSAGYVSPAYKASCDFLISQDAFVRDAIGIREQDEELSAPVERGKISRAEADLLAQLADRLYEAAILAGGIEASELPQIYLEFPAFRQSEHWLGFFSLRSLTEAVVSQRDDLVIVEDDPWRVARAGRVQPLAEVSAPPSPQEPATPIEVARQSMKAAIAEWIRGLVASSQAAVPMASLAQALTKRFGPQVRDSEWLGTGSFKGLLGELDLGTLAISSVTPGFVYDPQRHAAPGTVPQAEPDRFAPALSAEELDRFSLSYPDLAPLARKVNQLTDTPYLMPEHYALLLQELAREINERGYQMTRTSKTVRDRCVERGAPVARSHANFVLIGLGHTGHRLGQDLPEDPRVLGEALAQNTINLCRRAQLDLGDEEIAQIREWIMGSLD